jgi:hypothetical protein
MKWIKKWLGCRCDQIEEVAYEGQQTGRRLKAKVEKMEEQHDILKEKVKKLIKKHK